MSRADDNPLAGRIFTIRGLRVILDADLARLYGVTTKAFNQAIKRNAARFPEDFAFQLSATEVASLKSQVVTSSLEPIEDKPAGDMWSQIVTTSKPQRRRHSNRPWAFTEHGAVMAANVLRSPRAVEMSVYVVRAFVRMREELMSNSEILKRLAHIDKSLIEHDTTLQILWQRLQPLLAPPPETSKPRIGFRARGG
ncbi:MAG TPA: ORF6N domain-containing protein [Opitutaceae bacterium]|nr:ORF6N domain-containing protein [Opitutaceae bacterium]